ncbi:MAG: energy-coupling factor ABC transporter ATP-binding protein [Treponema sp.]|nr:energy-coupling factor ABC transporter ATP-binding protein [Treponema sp.]
MVSLVNVRYAYPRDSAFSLEVPALSFSAGECAAICGHNGSGKTTLGKLIAGLLRPLRGNVLLENEDIAGWPLGKIGGRVGYLFQEPSRQIFAPTVLEEITFPLVLKGMEESEAVELAHSMLARFEMGPLENAVTFTLSRGEKQRLAIVAMLVTNPGFLVLDEPTTGLDARRKGILGAMLRQLLGQNVGILLISHDTAFVKEYASRVHRMAEGRVLAP